MKSLYTTAATDSFREKDQKLEYREGIIVHKERDRQIPSTESYKQKDQCHLKLAWDSELLL
jgi:hypothetical protein